MSRRNPPNFGPASTMHQANIDNVMPLLWCWGSSAARPAKKQHWMPGVLWSGSRQGVGMADVSPPCMAGEVNGAVALWHIELMPHGAKQAKKIIGTTRDSGGSVLGSAPRSWVTERAMFSTGDFLTGPAAFGSRECCTSRRLRGTFTYKRIRRASLSPHPSPYRDA